MAVFAAITVPYVVLGLPFNRTLFWLYVLPLGVLTGWPPAPYWKSQRLPEPIIS
jgi:hypothetical protein